MPPPPLLQDKQSETGTMEWNQLANPTLPGQSGNAFAHAPVGQAAFLPNQQLAADSGYTEMGTSTGAQYVPPELAQLFAGFDTGAAAAPRMEGDLADSDILATMTAMPISGTGDAAWATNDWFEALWRT